MKNKLALFGIAGLAALGLSSYSVQQDSTEDQPKNSRHIKMVKIENGQKLELDTVISGDDVFVWNGDTISPEKHIKKFSPSEFDKLHHPGGDFDGQKDVKIYRHKGLKSGKPMIWEMDSADNVILFSELEGDSLKKKIIIRKRMGDGNEKDHFIYLNNMDGNHFPPMPPMPPMPRMKMMKMKQSQGMINLNDPNVISYKKKDISGGREKIEIIRHKSDENENMDFDFEFDDSDFVPEAPEPESFRYEFNSGDSDEEQIKKEIRVEVENQSETEEEVKVEETK